MCEKIKLSWRPSLTLIILFVGIFIASFIFQEIRWRETGMTDNGMWGDEVQYILQGNPKEFDFLAAYGHPGGPVIEGAEITHALTGLPYAQSVVFFVELFSSLIITVICAVCIALKKNNLWWIAALITMSLNRLYQYGTPPTIIAAALVVLLCLLTLYIYENKERLRPWHLLFWGFVAGLSIATRADIGIFSFVVFLLLISKKIGWKKVALLACEAFLIFAIFDPFMWFMPFQHIKDLIFKITYHYQNITPSYIGLSSILSFSSLAFLSIFLSMFFLFSKRRLVSPLPPIFVKVLIFMTSILYIIFLTAHSQAERYFLPIVFIWEVFLPLYIFSLIQEMHITLPFGILKNEPQTTKFLQILFILILLFYQIFLSLITIGI